MRFSLAPTRGGRADRNRALDTLRPQKDEVFLNLVLEYIPENLYRVARHYSKQKQTIPISFIKLYMYQLFRSLAYIHSLGK